MNVAELLLLIKNYLEEKGVLVGENQLGYETNLDGFVIFKIRNDGWVRIVPVYFSEEKKILVAVLPDNIYDLCFVIWGFFCKNYGVVNMSCRKKEGGLNSIILSFDKKVSGVEKSLIKELLKLAKRKE